MIENLALAGGGIKVISFYGALWYLNKIYDIRNIKRIIATSAGCIIALMLITNYSLQEMYDVIIARDMSDLVSKDSLINNIYRFVFDFGFNDGSTIEDWIAEILIIKKLPCSLTFKQLKEQFGKELIITITHLNKRQLKLLSVETTPNMPLIKAIRMSMTFPLYFNPIIEDEDIFLDGAIICNYPIEYLRKYDPYFQSTLGLNLIGYTEERDKYHIIDDIFQLINIIINTMYLEANAKNTLSSDTERKTITIHTKEIDVFDFKINNETKERLIGRGYRAAKEYFKKHK